MRQSLRSCFALAAIALPGLLASQAQAADATVQAAGVKFEAQTVYIEAGERVSWEGMNGHNVESLNAMIPEGGTEFNTQVGENVTLTFEEPGIYVYKCTPHWGARMGGVIVVGQPENPGQIIDDYLAAIETDRAGLLPAKGLLKDARTSLEEQGML